jgi:hypothetical protein
MATNFAIKVLDGKLSRIDELEIRIKNLETILTDIKMDLLEIRNEIKEDDLEKIDKLNKYQQLVDSILWKRTI